MGDTQGFFFFMNITVVTTDLHWSFGSLSTIKNSKEFSLHQSRILLVRCLFQTCFEWKRTTSSELFSGIYPLYIKQKKISFTWHSYSLWFWWFSSCLNYVDFVGPRRALQKKKKTRARFALHKTFTNKLQPRLPKKKRAHTVSARDRGPRILVKSIPLRKSFFWMHKKKLKFGQNRPKCSWIFLVHQQKSVTPFHNKIMVHSWILKKYCRPKPYPLFPDITVWSWKMENVPLFLSGTKELSFFGSLTYPPLSRYSCKFIKS